MSPLGLAPPSQGIDPMKLTHWRLSLNHGRLVDLIYSFHKITQSIKCNWIYIMEHLKMVYITYWAVLGCHIDKYAVGLFWHYWMMKFPWKSVLTSTAAKLFLRALSGSHSKQCFCIEASSLRAWFWGPRLCVELFSFHGECAGSLQELRLLSTVNRHRM